jgi:hypothetical protein
MSSSHPRQPMHRQDSGSSFSRPRKQQQERDASPFPWVPENNSDSRRAQHSHQLNRSSSMMERVDAEWRQSIYSMVASNQEEQRWHTLHPRAMHVLGPSGQAIVPNVNPRKYNHDTEFVFCRKQIVSELYRISQDAHREKMMAAERLRDTDGFEKGKTAICQV